MKKIYRTLQYAAMLVLPLVLATACSEEVPFETITPDDEPHILDPTFPDRDGGNLATFYTIDRDDNLSVTLTVTPAEYTTVTWYIDGNETPSGTSSDKELDISLPAGTYTLKMVATTTAGKSASREGLVKVNPLADDPWATTVAFERIVAPGAQARLYGDNLDRVAGIRIGSSGVTTLSYVEDAEGNYLEYTVPAELAAGEYRAVLTDAEGNEYGADKITVTDAPLVLSGAGRATSNAAWTITGINLDNVASLTVGGQTIAASAFTAQSASSITLTCPELADGNYTMTGADASGGSVQFLSGNAIVTELTVVVSTETTLWEGHHYVSWDLPDGDPNKTFNLIPFEVITAVQPGSILRVTYSIEPTAEYHQMKLATGWWTDLSPQLDFSEGGTYEHTFTQSDIDLMKEQGGFICVGHGYYVDLVTLK